MKMRLQKMTSPAGEGADVIPPRPRFHARDDAFAAPGASHRFGSIPIHPPASPDSARRDEGVHAAARQGVAGPGAEMPHLHTLQRSFGRHDLSGVRAHVGGEAAGASERIGATAYATGERVAFRGPPSLRTAAHEAAHVVQQRGGSIPPGAVGRAGDAHERHADAVAERVAQGGSAESLLDAYAPSAIANDRPSAGAAVQMEDEPTLTPYKTKGVVDRYAFTEKTGQKPVWIEAFKIAFLGDAGWDAFLWAKGKGYSTFAGLFIMAQASLESGFGQGNGGKAYHNLMSIMGGPKENIGTAHGHLQKFSSYAEGLDVYAKTLGKNFPGMVAEDTGLFLQESFTPDDVNKAFHQYNYYAPPVYLGDSTTDYGRDLFRRMGFIAGPLLAVIKDKISAVGAEWNMAYQQAESPDEADAEYWRGETSVLREEFKALNEYQTEIEAARATAATKLSEHEALKAAGKIAPKPKPAKPATPAKSGSTPPKK